MVKNRLVACLLVIILVFSSTSVFGQAIANIDRTRVDSGVVSINYKVKTGVKTKVMIQKGPNKYTYNLKKNENLPLQFGDGLYTVSILENVTGNKYRVKEQQDIMVKAKDDKVVYLQSVQNINWNKNMNAIKKAKELTKDAKTDKEKVEIIYDYITANISYDYKRANNLTNDYLPNIDEVLESTKGICYDYASLLASMLRSLDIPTKLLMGRKNDVDVYHGWNQVYIEELGGWVNIDTTYDAVLVKNKLEYNMIKDKSDYIIEKIY